MAGEAGAEKLAAEFETEVVPHEPWAEYVVLCQAEKRVTIEWWRGGDWEAGKPVSKTRRALRRKEEDPDEWCIYLGLRIGAPRDQIPQAYKGVRVLTEIIGDILVLGDE